MYKQTAFVNRYLWAMLRLLMYVRTVPTYNRQCLHSMNRLLILCTNRQCPDCYRFPTQSTHMNQTARILISAYKKTHPCTNRQHALGYTWNSRTSSSSGRDCGRFPWRPCGRGHRSPPHETVWWECLVQSLPSHSPEGTEIILSLSLTWLIILSR